MSQITEKPSGDLIRDTIDRILQRSEFKPRGKSLSEYLLDKLAEWLDRLFSNVGDMHAMPIAVIICLAVLVIVIAVFFVLRVRRARRLKDKKSGQVQAGGGQSGEELFRAAEILAGRGEFGKALVCLFLSHLKALEAHDFITIEKDKTNIQYERELINRGYDDTRGFHEFKNLFNAVRYGYLSIDGNAFGAWREYCLNFLQREDAA